MSIQYFFKPLRERLNVESIIYLVEVFNWVPGSARESRLFIRNFVSNGRYLATYDDSATVLVSTITSGI